MSNAPSTPESESTLDRSFEVLAAELRPMLTCYLTGILGDSHLAEDLAQETFLAAHRSLDRFEPGQNFGAWLRGIARNKVREQRRAAARRPLVVDSRIVEGMEEIFTVFDRPAPGGDSWGERLDVVRICIGKLKSGMRRTIECVYQRGHSLQETAAELDSSVAAVGQRLSRARTLIRQCVARQLPNQTADHGE